MRLRTSGSIIAPAIYGVLAGAPYYELVKEREGAPSFLPRCSRLFFSIFPSFSLAVLTQGHFCFECCIMSLSQIVHFALPPCYFCRMPCTLLLRLVAGNSYLYINDVSVLLHYLLHCCRWYDTQYERYHYTLHINISM